MGERQLVAVVQRSDGRQMVVGLRDPDRPPGGIAARLVEWVQRLLRLS
jgi:hypothetical protein